MKKIEKVSNLLSKRNLKIATAESCTGGLLSKIITDIPGSSKYFILGIVTYSNSAKASVLDIPKKVIKTHGAVSEEVAKLMADNIRSLAKSHIGVGITGIAGPTTAAPNKPVGTVCISASTKNKIIVKKFLFKGNRIQIRRKSVIKALDMVLWLIS